MFILAILAIVPLVVALYCIAANLIYVPSFKAVQAFQRTSSQHVNQLFNNIITSLSLKLAKIYPMNLVKRIEIQKLLTAANRSDHPENFMSHVWIVSVIPLPLSIPLFFAEPLFAVLPLALCWFLYNRQINKLKNFGERRKLDVEKEMPRYVAYMANTLKTERNILTCIDTYVANYDTPLTQELSITAADMRLGNAEMALQHFETRINSPFVSQLVRGLLSSMRGNDMTAYFENLSYTLTNVWEQRLRGQALRKQPKIERMSYLLFALALITVFSVIIAALASTSMFFGG